MSWLEKGISSLKGQITNLAKEVLAEEDTDSSAGAAAPEPGEQAAAAAAPADHEPAAAAAADRHHEEGYFGKALSGLPLFGRSSPETPSPDEQMRQHCSQLESTVQRLLQQLEEVSETRDKEALELATLRRELRLRADSGPGSASGSASGSGPGSGHSDSPQLPDDSGQQGADGTGVSPALSDDGFTKLDPSETELWEVTQELSQSLETQIELHKSELEKYHQMKQDWTLEKSNLENSVLKLQKELNALQDWQSPDPDFANESEVELKNTVSTLQKENEILQKQELEMSQRIKSLEANLSESEKERAQLASNVDELDAQNQEILQQFLHIKQSAQVKYDTLKSEHDKLLCHVKELEKETKNTSCTQKEKEVLAEKLCSLELELVSLKSEHELLQKRSEELEKDVSSVDTDKVSLLESENNELLSKYLQIESENHNLLAKMDSIQLDYDSLEVKYSALVSENETLKIKLGDVQCDLDSAKSELSEGLRADEHNTSEHSTTELSSIERYVIDKLRKIVSLEIPVEYCKDIAEKDEASGKELEDHLDMVAALVKMTVDLRWKKDTLERNLVEYSRQLRDLSAQLSGRDKQIAKLEEECVMLRENMESLLDGLNVAPEKGMLPSIPETSEAGEDELSDTASGLEQHGGQHRNEERDFNETIEKLEREIETLREARSTLEHETKRLRGELQELSARLRSSESMLRNQDNLEKEVERWRKECENLRSTQSELQTENSQLREEAEMARFGQDSLQAEVSEWKTIADSATLERQDATRVKELLVAEVAELKARVTASASLSTQLEQALKKKSTLEAEVAQLKNNVSALEESNKSLSEANHTIEELRTEIVDLRQELAKAKVDSIADDKMAELTSKIESLETQKSNLEHSVSELGSENAGLCEHIMTLQLKCDSLSADLACKASSEYDNTQNFLHEKQALEEQVNRMTCNYETVKKDFEELTNLKLALQSELEQLQQGFKEKCEENERYKESLQEKSVNEALINQQLEALSAAKCASEQEAQRLQEELQKLHNAPSQMANDNPLIVESLERKLHSMLAEKEQILSVLNEKTRDNGVLRSENQKLLEAVSSQAGNRSAQPSSDQTGQLVQQLNQLQVERDQLISTVQVKHNECLRYHAEIVRLSSLLDQRDAHQQIRPENDENKNFEVKNTSVGDLASKSPEILALEAKCADLAASLQQGQTQNAFLQNEMQEQHEKEGILTRELERLRAHLMEVEETYTAEALRLEEQVQDLQGKLNIAEDRLRNVSTAHTSASILANQHVETLQGQSRLIGQQRDELQSKLGAVEDREQKNAAALRNLQAVLEQFQRDKERDLASMTEKLRLELEAAHRKHNELFEEIKVLKSQLTEAKEGLSAAARLGAQLDKKSETINSLKEQISQLQKEIKGAEERVKTASQSVEGKVDKSLVKNLVVGLLTAPANTRSPALRVVASVLDFNLSERQRVGLEQGSAHNEQSLSEAFVRFLESESRPQMQLRLLPEANPKPNADGKKDSHGSSATSESPVRRSPLLSEVVLPTLAPLPVGRSSGSILKDVLKNDV